MKNVASWQFSAPLAKVDLRRIVGEAVSTVGVMGAIKVIVDVSKTESTAFVVADSDLAADAVMRTEKTPAVVMTGRERFRRCVDGVQCGPSIPAMSFEGGVAILSGGAVVVYSCENEEQADRLIAQLVDRVVVRVEAF